MLKLIFNCKEDKLEQAGNTPANNNVYFSQSMPQVEPEYINIDSDINCRSYDSEYKTKLEYCETMSLRRGIRD